MKAPILGAFIFETHYKGVVILLMSYFLATETLFDHKTEIAIYSHGTIFL